MTEKAVAAIKFPELKPEHIGLWVAMSTKTGEFIAAAKTLAETRRKAASFTERKTVFKVLPHIYAGTTV